MNCPTCNLDHKDNLCPDPCHRALYICTQCHTEADPGCVPDDKNPDDVWCEPCLAVVRLECELTEALARIVEMEANGGK